MKRNFLPFLLQIIFQALLTFLLHAQQTDFQCWPSAQLGVEVLKDLRLHVEEEVRFRENCTQIDRQINDLGISYRINKCIKTAVYYRIEAKWKKDGTHYWRQGFYTDISLRYAPGRFLFGYRTRFQTAKVEIYDNQDQLSDKLINRHKISIEYDIKNIPLAPFFEGEIFLNLAGNDNSGIYGYRTRIGMKYDFNKRHEVFLKFGIDQELNVPDPLRAYVVALGYAVDLKLYSAKRRSD